MRNIEWARLIIAILVTQAAGLVGAVATFPAVGSWYQTLNKPGFTPPDEVFGPVWTILYLLMGVALYLVWQERTSCARSLAISVFMVQLILNVIWSYLFFGYRQIGLALVEIILLWLAILVTIILFGRISKLAAYLLVPYLIWVTFAAVLNYSIWKLN